MKEYTVYRHTTPNGKMYIGITSMKPEKRWEKGRGYKHCPAFFKAIIKYGWENIKHEILFEGLTKKEAEAKEIEMIAFYKTTDKRFGYNIENGGNCTGTHSMETRGKISKANKGRIVSEETRKKASASHKGKQVGKDNPFYGRKHTEENKKKQSDFMKGNAYFKGHHHSDDFKRMKSEQMSQKYKDGGNPRCKAVAGFDVYGQIVRQYYSLRKASEAEGIPLTRFHNIVHKEQEAAGLIWRYIS